MLVNAAAEHLDFPRVSTDDAVAMEQAYGHLASLGHERIGLILGPAGPRALAPQARGVPGRRRAARAAARTAELVERTMFSLEGGQAAAARLIGSGATGIVCASDPLALGAIRAARRAGSRCPPTSRWSASTTRPS